MVMEKTPEQISAGLFNNMYMARIVTWMSDRPFGASFTATDIRRDLELVQPLISPVLHRLVQIDLITRHPRDTRDGYSVVPYSRNEHALWEPFSKLCRRIIESETEQGTQ